ncbi:MAG: FAD-dependent monooxygenase [Rhodospirillaceae bacterium]|nr:FAD-dependent monooxygenase [Rhodospirillaceae bacterium]
MRIAVIGGGPAGLFFARLAKRSLPGAELRIFEQNPADATYGFGVTLAGSARDRLRRADPALIDRLAEAMVFNDRQDIEVGGARIPLRYAASGGAIARLSLLRILESMCAEAGLSVEHGRRIEGPDDLAEFDLVVGADGANSVVRNVFAEAFGVRSRTLGNRFAWYGVAKALKPNALVFRRFEAGCYIAHYYAYAPSMSTFVAECDAETWEKGGLSAMTDGERKALMERIFVDVLDGAPLVENKSIWRAFAATTVDRWTHGNAVLIGDALRVAHFSIGSGTRLAMDDALALHDALVASSFDVAGALRGYVEARKPNRDLFTAATVRSFEWYEKVRQAMAVDPVAFVHGFLTRTGRVDDERLRDYVPGFYARYMATKKAG